MATSARPSAAWNGSPPRAWGQFAGAPEREAPERFTPTGVGTINKITVEASCVPVHPHGRGDNVRSRAQRIGAGGSPPRAWGQCGGSGRRCARRRFTPTGVGTIPSGAGWPNVPTVHPHGRGDNLHRRIRTIRQDGSPPRAWGQSPTSPRESDSRRFTPTGVGTIPPDHATGERVTVHPHGRGDNRSIWLRRASLRGSPPRAWGQYTITYSKPYSARFTPTGVGTMGITSLARC